MRKGKIELITQIEKDTWKVKYSNGLIDLVNEQVAKELYDKEQEKKNRRKKK